MKEGEGRSMHVMVCGGRAHVLTVDEMHWLTARRRSLPITVLIPGGGQVVDGALIVWAYHAGVRVEPIPADWEGTKAHGPHRSLAYLKLLHACLPPGTLAVLVLPGGSGTDYLRTGAQRLGLPVLTYPQKEPVRMPDMTVSTDPDVSPIPFLDDVPDVPEDIPDPALPDPLTAATAALPPQAASATLQKAPGGTPEGTTTPHTSTLPDTTWKEHEALLHGFLTHLLQRLNTELFADSQAIMQTIDRIIKLVDAAAARQTQGSTDVWTGLRTLLDGVGKGLQLHHDPYEAHVRSVSPEGFAVEICIRKAEAGSFVEALTGLSQWLQQQGYTPVAGA
jgi:hypothetical protein